MACASLCVPCSFSLAFISTKTKSFYNHSREKGLRFLDWNKVRPENIQNGFLTLKQQKTGQLVVIPLHPTVQAIPDKYEGDLPQPITN